MVAIQVAGEAPAAVHQRVCAGDHTVLFGRVQQFCTGHAAPLGFSRGRYAEVRPR